MCLKAPSQNPIRAPSSQRFGTIQNEKSTLDIEIFMKEGTTETGFSSETVTRRSLGDVTFEREHPEIFHTEGRPEVASLELTHQAEQSAGRCVPAASHLRSGGCAGPRRLRPQAGGHRNRRLPGGKGRGGGPVCGAAKLRCARSGSRLAAGRGRGAAEGPSGFGFPLCGPGGGVGLPARSCWAIASEVSQTGPEATYAPFPPDAVFAS